MPSTTQSTGRADRHVVGRLEVGLVEAGVDARRGVEEEVPVDVVRPSAGSSPGAGPGRRGCRPSSRRRRARSRPAGRQRQPPSTARPGRPRPLSVIDSMRAGLEVGPRTSGRRARRTEPHARDEPKASAPGRGRGHGIRRDGDQRGPRSGFRQGETTHGGEPARCGRSSLPAGWEVPSPSLQPGDALGHRRVGGEQLGEPAPGTGWRSSCGGVDDVAAAARAGPGRTPGSSLRSAEASASGSPVSVEPSSSASYSRVREIAIWISVAAIGARSDHRDQRERVGPVASLPPPPNSGKMSIWADRW